MPKFLWKGRYSIPGMQGVLQEGGTERLRAAEKAVQSAGGRIESFYFAFGDSDVYVIVDMPDDVSAAGVAMKISAAGGIALETVSLLTPEDIDQAVGVDLDYRPPGG